MVPVLMVAITPALLAAQQANANANATIATSASVSAPASVQLTGDAAADARIEAAIARVEAEGVSSASLANRVQLGRARGVAATRVAAAVENRADALIEARNALRASANAATSGTIELGADAIESGARSSQVAEVAARFQGEERPRALGVLASLAAEGRLGADVVASVRGALNSGAFAAGNASGATAGAGAGATTSIGGAASTTTGIAGGAASAGANVTGTIRGALPR